MLEHNNGLFNSGIFITFSGNCKKALKFYQSCFGGLLQFETFEQRLEGYTELPVICGSLVSEKVIIHGSDLIHNEGRKIGNYMAIFLNCKNRNDRKALIEKLEFDKKKSLIDHEDQQFIEIIDAFDVRWVLGAY